MKIIIIAAGSGKRVGEHTKDLPKYLLEINNKTILEHQLSVFKKIGYDEIIIITGPHKEKFTSNKFTYVEDSEYPNHDILGSLMVAKKHIFGEVLIVYSDIIFDDKILSQVIESKGDIGIAVDLNWEKSYEGRIEHPKSEAENVLLDKSHNLLEIRKNIVANSANAIGEFLGIIRLTANGSQIFVKKFEELEKSHKGQFHTAISVQKAYLTDMIQELIDSKIKVTPIIVTGKWCEIDTMQDLQRACKIFR